MTEKSTILIVDDEKIIRILMEGLLANQGYNLAFASNGVEALEKAIELTPDLILLDIMMPQMNGLEVCQRLRANPTLAEIPVIMITALDDRDSRLNGIKAGADDFISKPFDGIELQARVKTTTRLNRYRRLLMERNKFEWVVKQDTDGYLMLNHNGHILYVNPQARLYLGLPEDRKTFPEPFMVWVKRQYACEPEVAWNTWPNPPEVDSPRYIVRPESATANSLWLQVDLMEMSTKVQERFLVRLHDVSAKMLVQKLTWTFHEHVSHKLRTPLSKLTGFLHFLIEDDSKLSEEEKRMVLLTANRGAEQLQREILSIFNYMASLETDSSRWSRCDLAEIPNIITEVNMDLEIESIDFPSAGDVADLQVSTSYQILELTLREVLKNAQKFHPKGSPTIEIKISNDSTYVYIQVLDDGLTLSIEQLARMWIPYYQIEKGFSGQIPGLFSAEGNR